MPKVAQLKLSHRQPLRLVSMEAPMAKDKINSLIGTACRFSQVLAFLVAVSGAAGLFGAGTYARETPSWAAQGMGQDAVDLFLVAPLLWFCARGTRKGGRINLFFLAGLLIYIAYSFVLYAFCVHFNRLFFLYCASLGLSVYGLILLGLGVRVERVGKWFDRRKPAAAPALYLLASAAFFYLLWLAEDVPAVLAGTAPRSLAEAGLATNPVHVLDLSIVLPAMLAASVQLWRGRPSGYLLFPAWMVFSTVMSAALVGMAAAMELKGLAAGPALAPVFGGMTALNAAVLFFFLRVFLRP